MTTITMTPIGYVNSPFKECFGTPRQPGLVSSATGTITILPPYDDARAWRELADFSHIWVVFLFHLVEHRWDATVRPPRLGGNESVGVYASRSPFRPNRLGLSVLALERVLDKSGSLNLEVSGLDIVDKSPVLDIKPYLPYCDAIPTAIGGYAAQAPVPAMAVEFSALAESMLAEMEPDRARRWREVIQQTLALDPRPAYRAGYDDGRLYGVTIGPFDVKCRFARDKVYVEELLGIIS